MCGRYVLAMRAWQIRQMFQDNDMLVDDAPPDDGPAAPRQSYNFAPGYNGIVLRGTDAAPQDAAPDTQTTNSPTNDIIASPSNGTPNPSPTKKTATPDMQPHYRLQTMKWGLIPSWTSSKPNQSSSQQQPYTTTLKTINCRDDSLASPAHTLWSPLKARPNRRCIVVADGFYEWLKVGPDGKHRVPYYIKRKDGQPFCFAGLWEFCPPPKNSEGQREGEGVYSYTIITTGSCKALRFLHERMPVVMEAGGEAMRRWLGGEAWGKGLEGLLRTWEGELEVYKVSQEVGRVGRSEKRFCEPVEGGRGDIANFFGRAGKGKGEEKDVEVEVKDEDGEIKTEVKTVDEVEEAESDVKAPVTPVKGVKREAEIEAKEEPPAKKMAMASPSPVKPRPKISATSNVRKTPKKGVKDKGAGSQKITKFFGNSA